MIGTDLAVHQRKDIVPLAKQNLVLGSKSLKLPSDKGVIVGIDSGRNKGTSPVDAYPEILQMGDSNWGEIFQPMVWVNKLWNFFSGDHLGKNIPLTNDSRTCLLYQLGFASFGLVRVLGSLGICRCLQFCFHLCSDLGIIFRELRRTSEQFNLSFQLVSSLENK